MSNHNPITATRRTMIGVLASVAIVAPSGVRKMPCLGSDMDVQRARRWGAMSGAHAHDRCNFTR